MKHIPHLVVLPPWSKSSLQLSEVQGRHLAKVLRMEAGDEVTYTDGEGTFGSGMLLDQTTNEPLAVERGREERIPRPTNLTVVVAPPANKDRQRFLVEKLAELGTERLLWLRTRYGMNRVASVEKLNSWVSSATEQSRGAWLMEVGTKFVDVGELESGWVVCQPGGEKTTPKTDTVVIGSEGGFAEDELPGDTRRWDLGPNILRVETAALVAVAKLTRG